MRADEKRFQPGTVCPGAAGSARLSVRHYARGIQLLKAMHRTVSPSIPLQIAMMTAFGFGLLIGIWPAYVWLAWRIRRAAGRRPLVLLWIAASAVYGYLRYRYTCSQALTCDVGGTSPYFLPGNPYYFIHYVPVFAAIGLVAFGVASVIVDLRGRGGVQDWSAARTLAVGTLGAMVSFILASVVAASLSIHPV